MEFRVVGDRSSDGGFSNTATISFKILEQDDAVSLQILYAGGPQAGVSFAGAIEGAKILRLQRPLDAFRDSSSRESELRKSAHQTFALLFLMPIILPLVILVITTLDLGPKRALRMVKEIIIDSTFFWFISIFWVVCVSAAYYYLFYFYPAIPQDVLS